MVSAPYTLPGDHPVIPILSDLRLPKMQMESIVAEFIHQINDGLAHDDRSLKMIPSFVSAVPTGEETGTYLALDFGGTNFRVCSVTLQGARKFKLIQQKATIPADLRIGCPGDQLFDFIAEEVFKFVKANDIDQATAKLGFTFSFAVKATGLNSGTLLAWSKNIDAPDVVGKDVVDILRQAFERKGLEIEVAALVNDTVGALMANAYCNPKTKVAIIIGTGTNAAYVEQISHLPKWDSYAQLDANAPSNPTHMVINMEWGNFDQPINGRMDHKELYLFFLDYFLFGS